MTIPNMQIVLDFLNNRISLEFHTRYIWYITFLTVLWRFVLFKNVYHNKKASMHAKRLRDKRDFTNMNLYELQYLIKGFILVILSQPIDLLQLEMYYKHIFYSNICYSLNVIRINYYSLNDFSLNYCNLGN